MFDELVRTTYCQFFVIPARAEDKRRLGSSYFNIFWIPAYAGTTEVEIFFMNSSCLMAS